MAGMSILDDAIREHLELKRAHGADESELKKLEDEAFGPPQRPDEIDPFAEAPTEFMGLPEAETTVASPEEGGRRTPNITDLQEAPEARTAEPAAPEAAEPQEAEPEGPAEEQQPAAEQPLPEVPESLDAEAEVEADAPADPEAADHGPDTQERHAIADQPTEVFDVESATEPDPDPAASEARSPSDEDLVDAEAAAPRLSPVDPPAGIEASASGAEAAEEPVLDEEDEDDDFWSEQRLSDELNQALEAPVTEEHPVQESPPAAEPLPAEPELEDEASDQAPNEPEAHDKHDDVLEDTPDFLEDAPEDDNLWFEQRPPKDFDFDD
jgi:hypothetical protein